MDKASMDQTKDELIAQAEDLGLEVSSRDTKEILVSKINEVVVDPEEIEDAPAPAPKPKANKPSNGLKKFHKFTGAKA